jgi:acetyl-CoA C-acetyltransferase
MRPVSVVGIGQVPVEKAAAQSLRQLGSAVLRLAMEDSGIDQVDAVFVGNMLSDELQGQKHVAVLIADEAGLAGVEALEVQAATATGAASLRMAYLAVASGQAELAAAVGVEKMSAGVATPALTKALDAEIEIPQGATLIGKNAGLMRLYREKYSVPEDGLAEFAVNAHRNARNNPMALFRAKKVSKRDVMRSRMIHDPIRLYDCSPICDGAAAVILAPTDVARAFTSQPVQILASSVATDRFRMDDRKNPLALEGVQVSAQKAFVQANLNQGDISFFEAHDAFSIMACLQLEAAGFAEPGMGWRLAAEKEISPKGKIPIATMGGLKARGHPIGASALYQTCETVLQLTDRAGKNQVKKANIGMVQSVGGVASTVITHIFRV